MSDLKFEIDVKALTEGFGSLKKDIEKDVTEAAENLANMTHAKLLELSRDELRSLSKLYSDNVEFTNPAKNFWVVTLKEPAMFIEEGRKSGWMQELLDGKSGKVSKDGKKYAVIPFEHSKAPSEQSPKAQQLANQIRDSLKQKGVSWQKIEKGPDGSPLLGRLHSFNLEGPRIKPHHKSAATKGVTIYQSKDKSGNVRRDVMTFRVISEKHREEGLWVHPGRQGSKLMPLAYEWAVATWERDILPAIFDKYKSK